MGVQLSIPHQSMLDAGFEHKVVVDTFNFMGEDGEMLVEELERGVYSHPEKGTFSSYITDGYFWDSNVWGGNRALQEKAGLLHLPGAELV